MRWKCQCCGQWCNYQEKRHKEGDLQRNRFLVARQEWFLFRCIKATQFCVRVAIPVDSTLESSKTFLPFNDETKRLWAELDKSRPGGSSDYETTMSEYSERVGHGIGDPVLKRYFQNMFINQHARIKR